MRIFCDGGSRGNPGPAASAFVVYKEDRLIYSEARYLGEATNNVAEYTALLMAMEWLKDNPAKNVSVVLDSELVKKQITGEYRIKNENLKVIATKILKIVKDLSENITFVHTLRDNNSAADKLVNLELDKQN